MLTCEAESMPKPGIAWQKHREHIEDGKKYTVTTYSETDAKVISELEFTVELKDGGRYMCVASNEHGQNHHTIELNGSSFFYSLGDCYSPSKTIHTPYYTLRKS